jgi:RNA polymerase sigma factor (TIGR02999 family)
MANTESKKITRMLADYRKGDKRALEELLPAVYDHLHRLAENYMRRERSGHTLQPTALVNEAFVRIVRGAEVDWKDRAHFFAIAASVMRRILVDHAKAKRADKRGGGGVHVAFDEAIHGGASGNADTDLLELDGALERLAAVEPRWAKVIELRYFGGLEIDAIAEALGVSPATVKRDFSAAKLWLFQALNPSES